MSVKQACAAIAAVLTAGMGVAIAQEAAAPPAAADPAAPVTLGPQAPPPEAPVQNAEGVAAIVNDEVISTYDVRQRSALILASAGVQPSSESMQQVRMQALRDLVDEHLQIQEAKEYEIKIDPKEVDEAIEGIAKSNGASADQFKSQLVSVGAGVATLRTQLEADIAWRRLIGGRYGSRVRISNVQIEETLSRIAANATKPQYLIAEILLAADNPTEMADAENAANQLLDAMKRGVNFQQIARQVSSAPSAAAGGDLGWLAQGELKPELQAVVDQMQPGSVSTPIRAPNGIYILALREKRDGVDPKTVTRVTLKQISAPLEVKTGFDRARRRINGCASVANAVASIAGAEVTDLGEIGETELADDQRTNVESTPVGQATAMVDKGDKTTALVVCARNTAGGALPSRDQIEDKLYEQELALLSERYLRNLRRESTIITR